MNFKEQLNYMKRVFIAMIALLPLMFTNCSDETCN